MSLDQAKFDLELGHRIRQLVSESPHRALAVEFRHCPHCEQSILAVHPFAEVLSCSHCGGRFPAKSPSWPVGGEPRAIDWEDAVMTIGTELPAVAERIYRQALESAAQR